MQFYLVMISQDNDEKCAVSLNLQIHFSASIPRDFSLDLGANQLI